MLTSTKRRVLNVICVTLAIASVSYGLVLRYERSTLEAAVVQENELKIEDETLEADPALVLRANNPFTNPNN
ncbi:hypothetical protein BFP97_11415 [Roseivirga sp. 4D4]|uniref:hypothetical protein n=1 Tax=Roseivirga sp. 4D4 TaxID=1889784 RepID=UPI000853A703|nr:hypothetical protein [Roseivirga sp. 4D4]OEK02092.1 hypothetical protein BFP97_11415 [Roseivirga sp. 4D4]